MPSSSRRPRPAKSAPAASYSPGWLPTPTPSTRRPPDRWASAAASLATEGGCRRGSCKTHDPTVARVEEDTATPRALMVSRAGECQ